MVGNCSNCWSGCGRCCSGRCPGSETQRQQGDLTEALLFLFILVYILTIHSEADIIFGFDKAFVAHSFVISISERFKLEYCPTSSAPHLIELTSQLSLFEFLAQVPLMLFE